MNLQPHDATPEGKDQSIYVIVLMKRCTKALRSTATGYQGHERIIDFRLFHSRMIRPVVGGGGRACLKQTRRRVAGDRFKVKHE